MQHRDGSIESPIPMWIPTSELDYNGRKISILTPHLIAGVYSLERNQVMPNPNFEKFYPDIINSIKNYKKKPIISKDRSDLYEFRRNRNY